MAITDVEAAFETGPSDRELIGVLQRVASARAHLSQAERAARAARSEAEVERGRAIELAHAEVIWAQAGALTSPRSRAAHQTLDVALAREDAVLRRHGFATFAEYFEQRHEVSSADVHLDLARREHAAAQAAWSVMQEAMAPTMIIDLTGDEPRIL
jgi:hypothetical protein